MIVCDTVGTGVQDFQQPELKRTPLAELCLQAKLVGEGTPIAAFLAQAIDPPVPQAVEAGVTLLQVCCANGGFARFKHSSTPCGRPRHPLCQYKSRKPHHKVDRAKQLMISRTSSLLHILTRRLF